MYLKKIGNSNDIWQNNLFCKEDAKILENSS